MRANQTSNVFFYRRLNNKLKYDARDFSKKTAELNNNIYLIGLKIAKPAWTVCNELYNEVVYVHQ